MTTEYHEFAEPQRRVDSPEIVSPTARLASQLRGIGSVILMLAIAVLLIQGLGATLSVLERNWVVPLIGAAMGALGTYCGLHLRDTRTARVLFGFATALFAVQMSQIGASMFELSAVKSGALPPIMAFGTFSPFTAMTLTWGEVLAQLGVGLILQLPFAYFGFALFARADAKFMTACFAIFSLLLLIPLRVGSVSFLILATSVGFTSWIYHQRLKHSTLQNPSSILAYGLMALPLLIMLCRRLCYPLSAAEAAGLLAILSAWIYWFGYKVNATLSVKSALYFTATAMLLAANATFILSFHHWFQEFFGNDSVNIGLTLQISALILFGAAVAAPTGAVHYRATGAVFSLLAIAALWFGESVFWPTVAAALSGGLCVAIGVYCRGKAPVVCGIAIVVLAAEHGVALALSSIHFTPLFALTVLGLALLLGAALLERQGSRLIGRVQRLAITWRSYD